MHYTESKAESMEIFNRILLNGGESPMDEDELRDYGIIGGESEAQIKEWANDLLSEIHTEKCEAKDSWRYEL